MLRPFDSHQRLSIIQRSMHSCGAGKKHHTHTSTHTIRTGIEVNANEAVGFCELCLCHSCSMHTVLCDIGWFIALSSTCMQNALTEFPSNRLEAHLHSSIESYAYWACIPFPKLDWFNGNGEHVNRNDCWWHVRQNMSERFSRQVKKKNNSPTKEKWQNSLEKLFIDRYES